MFRSGLEARFHRLWTATYPHIQFTNNYHAHGYELDFVHLETRIVIEVDSKKHHFTPERFQKDREKDRKLSLYDWRVLRVTDEQLAPHMYRKTLKQIHDSIQARLMTMAHPGFAAPVPAHSSAQQPAAQSRKRGRRRRSGPSRRLLAPQQLLWLFAGTALVGGLVALLVPALIISIAQIIFLSAFLAMILSSLTDAVSFSTAFLCLILFFGLGSLATARLPETEADNSPPSTAQAHHATPPSEADIAAKPLMQRFVRSFGLNMRSEPYAEAAVLRELSQGTRVEILEQQTIDNAVWARIRPLDQPTLEGWVNATFLQE